MLMSPFRVSHQPGYIAAVRSIPIGKGNRMSCPGIVFTNYIISLREIQPFFGAGQFAAVKTFYRKRLLFSGDFEIIS
jgi:hypothetical protein